MSASTHCERSLLSYSCAMLALVRTWLLILFGPIALLLIWAHLVRPWLHGLDFAALITAALIGGVGIATAPWRREIKVAAGLAYVMAAVLLLPIGGLFAVCSTGDCL